MGLRVGITEKCACREAGVELSGRVCVLRMYEAVGSLPSTQTIKTTQAEGCCTKYLDPLPISLGRVSTSAVSMQPHPVGQKMLCTPSQTDLVMASREERATAQEQLWPRGPVLVLVPPLRDGIWFSLEEIKNRTMHSSPIRWGLWAA